MLANPRAHTGAEAVGVLHKLGQTCSSWQRTHLLWPSVSLAGELCCGLLALPQPPMPLTCCWRRCRLVPNAGCRQGLPEQSRQVLRWALTPGGLVGGQASEASVKARDAPAGRNGSLQADPNVMPPRLALSFPGRWQAANSANKMLSAGRASWCRATAVDASAGLVVRPQSAVLDTANGMSQRGRMRDGARSGSLEREGGDVVQEVDRGVGHRGRLAGGRHLSPMAAAGERCSGGRLSRSIRTYVPLRCSSILNASLGRADALSHSCARWQAGRPLGGRTQRARQHGARHLGSTAVCVSHLLPSQF